MALEEVDSQKLFVGGENAADRRRIRLRSFRFASANAAAVSAAREELTLSQTRLQRLTRVAAPFTNGGMVDARLVVARRVRTIDDATVGTRAVASAAAAVAAATGEWVLGGVVTSFASVSPIRKRMMKMKMRRTFVVD